MSITSNPASSLVPSSMALICWTLTLGDLADMEMGDKNHSLSVLPPKEPSPPPL